jgi:hypothetical protein
VRRVQTRWHVTVQLDEHVTVQLDGHVTVQCGAVRQKGWGGLLGGS